MFCPRTTADEDVAPHYGLSQSESAYVHCCYLHNKHQTISLRTQLFLNTNFKEKQLNRLISTSFHSYLLLWCYKIILGKKKQKKQEPVLVMFFSKNASICVCHFLCNDDTFVGERGNCALFCEQELLCQQAFLQHNFKKKLHSFLFSLVFPFLFFSLRCAKNKTFVTRNCSVNWQLPMCTASFNTFLVFIPFNIFMRKKTMRSFDNTNALHTGTLLINIIIQQQV